VLGNALFKGNQKVSDLVIPWCTYTEPEIAHVGLYEHDASGAGIEVDTFTTHFDDVDRAITDGNTEGFVRIHIKKGSDKIVGATIVGDGAGDLISEITLAMVNNIGMRGVAKTIHPYPTRGEAIKKTADAYNRTRLTPFVKKVFRGWLSFSR
jgi:pyruvate/2-oxoglutarate dehydrogenase complex dihydrolipoamide dehydrogenase (E3) component